MVLLKMKNPLLIALAIMIVIGSALFLPRYVRTRERMEEAFAAFDRLEASVTANAGILESKHRLVEATAGYQRLVESQPHFPVTDAGKALSAALQYYSESTGWRDIKQVRSKTILMSLPEVPLNPPTSEDRELVQYLGRRQANICNRGLQAMP